MKQPFGAKPAGFCMRSMRWIAVNRKKEDAASASMIGETCRRPSTAIVEFGAVEQFGAALPKALFILAPAAYYAVVLTSSWDRIGLLWRRWKKI
jgi:hypothetical protein